MKIVDRDTFLRLPPGTLFSIYEPCIFGELRIKEDSIFLDHGSNDFFYQDITDSIECSGSDERFAKLDHAKETGTSLDLDLDCQSRDGCYDYDELYAVWERPDVEALIAKLQDAHRRATGDAMPKEKP